MKNKMINEKVRIRMENSKKAFEKKDFVVLNSTASPYLKMAGLN